MPSNTIRINKSDQLAWVVPDSKMEAVLSVLDAVGTRNGGPETQEALVQSREDTDKAFFGKLAVKA